MILGRQVAVILPAYNAEKTLERTFHEIPKETVDLVILVDDGSTDSTVQIARTLGISVFVHPRNRGYGANQKTCYLEALRTDADIITMLHPDYQYSPRLVTAMCSMIASDEYDVVLGSRILVRGAIDGGMPRYKYYSNRLLTLVENLLLSQKISEYHTGFRAFRREVLERLPLAEDSDDFVFDNQILAQVIHFGYRIGEISCPARYFPEASSIGPMRSLRYGIGVLKTATQFRLHRMGLLKCGIFREDGARLEPHGSL